jgi:hypothetical protein
MKLNVIRNSLSKLLVQWFLSDVPCLSYSSHSLLFHKKGKYLAKLLGSLAALSIPPNKKSHNSMTQKESLFHMRLLNYIVI